MRPMSQQLKHRARARVVRKPADDAGVELQVLGKAASFSQLEQQANVAHSWGVRAQQRLYILNRRQLRQPQDALHRLRRHLQRLQLLLHLRVHERDGVTCCVAYV